MSKGQIILEFISKGAYMQINAIDVETGIEATSIAPINLARFEMENLARRKLEYVMKKKSNNEDETIA